MHHFTDRNGRQWNLDLTISGVKRIKSLAGVDLLDAQQGGVLEMFAASDLGLIDILFALVKPQADQHGITDEQFGDAIGGPEMAAGVVALRDEITDFFLQARPPLGHAMRELLAKADRQQEQQTAAAVRMMASPQVDEYLEQAVSRAEQAFSETLGRLCTSSPASLGSTQED